MRSMQRVIFMLGGLRWDTVFNVFIFVPEKSITFKRTNVMECKLFDVCFVIKGEENNVLT